LHTSPLPHTYQTYEHLNVFFYLHWSTKVITNTRRPRLFNWQAFPFYLPSLQMCGVVRPLSLKIL
jgi:hypothetical protein